MKNTFWTYFKSLISNMKCRVALSLILIISVGLTEGIGLLLFIPLLQLVGLHTTEGTIGQLARFISSVFTKFGIPITLITVLLVYVSITSISALLSRSQTLVNNYLENKFVLYLRVELHKAISNTSWLFFSKKRSSDFTQILINELDRVGIGTHFFLQVIANSIITLVYLLLALQLSPQMTLITLICGVILLFLFKGQINKVYRSGEQISKETSSFYSASIEHFSGMKTTKSYCAEEKNVNIFSNLSSHRAQMFINLNRLLANVRFWFAVGSVLILSFILYVSFNVLKINTASVLLLLYLFARVMPRFSNIQQDYHQVINMLPAFANVNDLQIKCEAAKEVKIEDKETIEFQKTIELNNISFSYEKEKAVIENLNLIIKRGEFISIVGPSGSGKSTIADLIMGLLTPDKGYIKIDNNPLSAERINSWRSHIGYVTQDTFLFHDTVHANLLWACPNASEKEIKQALKLAACEEFISTLPEGLETILGDRGIRLSGGERQRLALARALLRKPSLLILDEATSSLDSENEKQIQGAIEQLHGEITVLIISHRLSMVCNSDRIYVLDKGKIVETGDWNSLVSNKNGRFYKLFSAKESDLNYFLKPKLIV
ncbi:MAG: ABC transporter ATP-binding protein [Candidatus Melainabacteria bacterium]|nr:ABC transporter ATP-binding protein [Candidatus Melainabacteria bacterium]